MLRSAPVASTAPRNPRADDPTDRMPELAPVPGWRKPIALVGWGLLIAVLIGLLVYGIFLLSQGSGSAPATTTTTKTTTTTSVPPPTTTTTDTGPPTTEPTTDTAPPTTTSTHGWRPRLRPPVRPN